jgi:hypothetical protein
MSGVAVLTAGSWTASCKLRQSVLLLCLLCSMRWLISGNRTDENNNERRQK